MDIGPMRQRIQIQTCQQMADKMGQMRTTWQDSGTYWASIRFLSGRELLNANQVKATVTHQIVMRYVGPISPTSRLVHNNRAFNIDSISTINEIKRTYIILCHEVVQPS